MKLLFRWRISPIRFPFKGVLNPALSITAQAERDGDCESK
ncbi:hypothetical protein HOLDEFILI_00927 [Holdemania filiformis DSM 12042]|uniref:Uncharacterized protein n=1 Tax=Holdemania filiformis DSM 12042 TaxID=545696 RepID=B9Y546_9FIRM|nr:hypothetical protein HOLDEFILI_00927 [Holdemania filiformis DSM 12042]